MPNIIILLALMISGSTFSATVNERICIFSDSLEVSTGGKIPYVTFSETESFNATNARIELNIGDELDVWVVNYDTVVHEFQIKGFTVPLSIPVNDSINVVNIFPDAGVYIYLDPLNFPDNAYLGLSGMIVVKDHSHASFYWNIKEHKDTWNSILTSGSTVNWNDYYPNFFTINGKSSPNINLDPAARITGNVGDTLMIYVTNTGQSIHPLHFHGYHVDIQFSSRNPEHVGRSKDSQGVYPYEGVVFRLIPDKPGEFPVHDHNLIATTGGNYYPLGMFLTMLIQP
ncbi:MAG: multicopper oxidase domain-containing protein [Crocinitomicaceae bacterium]|nr:multicopper oxidase domain-containing protein [Crocinitomicaceae bacterium]